MCRQVDSDGSVYRSGFATGLALFSASLAAILSCTHRRHRLSVTAQFSSLVNSVESCTKRLAICSSFTMDISFRQTTLLSWSSRPATIVFGCQRHVDSLLLAQFKAMSKFMEKYWEHPVSIAS